MTSVHARTRAEGQRYTPKGGPNALYAAEDLVTAHAEYHRVERIVLAADPTYRVSANPTVELTIQVNLERVLNIVDPVIQAALATTVAELTGPWRKQMIKKLFCPTQVLSLRLAPSARFYCHSCIPRTSPSAGKRL
jgi:RES domain-containing protein